MSTVGDNNSAVPSEELLHAFRSNSCVWINVNDAEHAWHPPDDADTLVRVGTSIREHCGRVGSSLLCCSRVCVGMLTASFISDGNALVSMREIWSGSATDHAPSAG